MSEYRKWKRRRKMNERNKGGIKISNDGRVDEGRRKEERRMGI